LTTNWDAEFPPHKSYWNITAENIDTVLPLLAVSQEVKTDIINGIHAGQHAIVPQREIQHGNWQGSGYIIQDSITGAGAYLLEGGLNGGALEGLSCDASKNPMAALINMVIQVMELYFNIVAMISFGSFALAAVALIAFRVMVKTLLKAVVKKQVKKKRAKKRKKKKRTECDCDKKKKKTRKGKTGKDECEPELKLVSVEFVKDLPIYKDQIGKAPEITGAQWQDKTFDGEPEIDEPIAYVSSQSGTNKKACEAKKATCLTVTAKFKVTHLPDNWKNKSIRIQGKVSGSSRDNEGNEKRFNTKLLGKTKLPEKLGEIVKIEKVMSEKALPKKITQFYDTLNIKWQFFAFDTKEVKWIQTSKHQVYVTFDKPYLEEMEALYLSALHFAVSNDGATSKQEVVEKSWQMFTQKDMEGKWGPANITAWDEKRKLYYYPSGGEPEEREKKENHSLQYCLGNPGGYGQCGDFADLFSHVLSVNRIPHSLIGISLIDPSSAGKMLIKNWELKEGVMPEAGKEYPYQLLLFPKDSTDKTKGKMTSPLTGESESEYGDFINLEGIAGQNMKTPSEKVFSSHIIVQIDPKALPPKWEPYFDPSYGVTYENEEDFAKDAVYGYVQSGIVETDVIDEVKRLILKAKPADPSDNFIKFTADPICCN